MSYKEARTRIQLCLKLGQLFSKTEKHLCIPLFCRLQEQELVALFAKAGLACLEIRAHDQEIENRKRDLIMSRRWAVFQMQGLETDIEMSDATNAWALTKQQQQQQQEGSKGRGVSLEMRTGNGREALPLAFGKGWLSGAAGRLASCTSTLPGA
eukprot:1156791-Pelagomonas_calceolata.AAC.3